MFQQRFSAEAEAVVIADSATCRRVVAKLY